MYDNLDAKVLKWLIGIWGKSFHFENNLGRNVRILGMVNGLQFGGKCNRENGRNCIGTFSIFGHYL